MDKRSFYLHLQVPNIFPTVLRPTRIFFAFPHFLLAEFFALPSLQLWGEKLYVQKEDGKCHTYCSLKSIEEIRQGLYDEIGALDIFL
jgi:hypothetical protein